MKYLFLCLALVTTHYSNSQTVNFEQLSLNYFMDTIFKERYEKIRIIEFSGKSEDHLTNLEMGNDCFNDSNQLGKK